MNISRFIVRSASLIFICVGLAVLSPVVRGQDRPRGDGRGPGPGDLRGLIKSVDSGASTITVMVAANRQAPEEKTFTVAKTAEIAVMDASGRRGAMKEAKLADLTSGLTVFLELSADQKSVESIAAEGPTVRGVIKSIDVKNRTFSMLQLNVIRGEEPMEKSYTLDQNAEIGVDDGKARRFSIKEGKITDLKVGAHATIWLTVDQKLVQSALVEGSILNGKLKAVDATKGTITVEMGGRGGDAEETTVAVAKDAIILHDDGKGRRLSQKEGKLADTPIGSFVNVRLSADQETATSLRAEGPSMPGQLRSVDPVKGTITIAVFVARGENPEEKTFAVAKDARMVIDGKPVKLDELKPDDNGPFVQARLSFDQKTIQSLQGGMRNR